MKTILPVFIAIVAFVLFSFIDVCPIRAQENEEGSQDTQETGNISEEDQKVIEKMELLENLDLFIEGEIEMLHNLELLMVNS